MTLRPVEWEIRHPLSGDPIAIARVVHLGSRQEPYTRAVTANPVTELRRLIGYWVSPQDPHDGVLAILEQSTGRAIEGGDQPPRRELVPQKPPPSEKRQPGRPAKPRRHATRA